jgi:hypothetical protein
MREPLVNVMVAMKSDLLYYILRSILAMMSQALDSKSIETFAVPSGGPTSIMSHSR